MLRKLLFNPLSGGNYHHACLTEEQNEAQRSVDLLVVPQPVSERRGIKSKFVGFQSLCFYNVSKC